MRLSLVLPRHRLGSSLRYRIPYLFEVQDHSFTLGLVGIFYLSYYQLGVAADLKLVNFQ